MSTITVRPNSYATGVDYSAFGVSNASNIYDSNSSTNGTLSMTGSELNEGYDIAFSFNCSGVPAGATINSVEITWTGKTNYADRFINVWMQARSGSNTKGNQTYVSDSSSQSTATITGLSFIRSELDNFNVLYHADHGGNTHVGYYYLYDLYAVIDYTITASYTVSVNQSTGGTLTLSQSGIVAQGTSITVTAAPDSGYTLGSILVNGSVISGNSFIVAGDSVVTATWTYTGVMKIKSNGSWITVNAAYKKINGSWVKQTDLQGLFNTAAKYVKMN